MEVQVMNPVSRNDAPHLPAWLRRLGFAGFLFFLAKGLLWLTVPCLATILLN
jgi:hypothetical protein